jgi:hypothetical protein
MPKIPFLLFGACSLFLAGRNPYGPGPVSVQAFYDSSAVPEVLNTVPIGFTFIFPGGRRESTSGWNGGHIPWRSLTIYSPQGTVEDGVLTFDRQKVWNNGHSISFTVELRNATLACSLVLPYVRRMRFNLYTDSIKRNIPFYLNVEGRFSSGRIYPLDTGMIAFSSSAGSLAGSVLTVKNDTSVHRAEVSAWLKADPGMRISVSIPVKIVPDTAAVPTAPQLLREWKKEDRQSRQRRGR